MSSPVISELLSRIRRDPPKAQEGSYRAFNPPVFPEGHSCLNDPFPWRVAASTTHQLLRPCPSCGHAVAAHTYDRPCPLCVLEQKVDSALRSLKRSR